MEIGESQASLSEWLRSLTRNQMGSARTGSNPVARALFALFMILEKGKPILKYKFNLVALLEFTKQGTLKIIILYINNIIIYQYFQRQ